MLNTFEFGSHLAIDDDIMLDDISNLKMHQKHHHREHRKVKTFLHHCYVTLPCYSFSEALLASYLAASFETFRLT